MEINALNNDLVKKTVRLHMKKYRDEEGKFLLEGYKSIYEAYIAGVNIDYVFVHRDKVREYAFLNNDKIIVTNKAVLEKISTTDTPPDAAGAAYKKLCNKSILKKSQKLILLENIRDPGNLGTILRTCAAFEYDAVILYGDCTDIYSPKCVRSSVGNLWKIPVFEIKTLAELKEYTDNFNKIATLPKSDESINLKDFQPKTPFIAMFGSEADGLSEELTNISDSKITIEMSPEVESLNLSVSCAIVCYEFSK